MARVVRPSAAVVVKPDPSSTPRDETIPESAFSSRLSIERSTGATNNGIVAELIGLPQSGYDSFTSSKNLSTNRPHLLSSYVPQAESGNLRHPTFQLSELQYLLDNDTLSTATQLISSSLPSADLSTIETENISLLLESRVVLDALKSVYSSKNRLSNLISVNSTSITNARSSLYRSSLPDLIGIDASYTPELCREPFFSKTKISDYFSSIPTSLSRFSEKTFSSRIFNLALMANDLCYFTPEEVSRFSEDPDIGDKEQSALYVRDQYPADITAESDYVVAPGDGTLEKCMVGLCRKISTSPIYRNKRSITVYDSNESRDYDAPYVSLLSSLFTPRDGKQVEVFLSSRFLNFSPQNYASFEDLSVLSSFSKDQVDAVGFQSAYTLVNQSKTDLTQFASSLSRATSGFEQIAMNESTNILSFTAECIKTVGSLFSAAGLSVIQREEEFTYESQGSLLLDFAFIMQNASGYSSRFPEVIRTESYGAFGGIFPIEYGSITSSAIILGDWDEDLLNDSSAGGLIQIDSSEWWSTISESHPILSAIDRLISRFGFSDDLAPIARSLAYQAIGRAFKSVIIIYRSSDEDPFSRSERIQFYRGDLAAISRSASELSRRRPTEYGYAEPAELSDLARNRINSTSRKIISDALSPLKTLTDQSMLCFEISDIGSSIANSFLSIDLPDSLRSASTALSRVSRIKGITPVLALSRESLTVATASILRRLQISSQPYYGVQEFLSEDELKLSVSKIRRDQSQSRGSDDVGYFLVGFPFGLLERCRNSVPGDVDTFAVTFRFVFDYLRPPAGGAQTRGQQERTVTRYFSPQMKKFIIPAGQASAPIDRILPDSVKCVSYIDGVDGIVSSRRGESVFSVLDVRDPSNLVVESALTDGTVSDFVWNLTGINFDETSISDGARYAEPAQISDIRRLQQSLFSRKIENLDNATQARLGSAFERTRIFGQGRSIDEVFGFKYFDCIYAFRINTSEIVDDNRAFSSLGRVFISVEPANFQTRGNF